jgi:hypothetical protein
MTYPTSDNHGDRAETYRALQSHDRALSAAWDPDPTLDRAVVALKDQPIPHGPPDSLLAKTLASLREAEPQVLAPSPNSLRIFLRPLAIAAGLLISISVIAIILLNSSSVAFAEVAKKVRDSRTLIFTVPVPNPDDGTLILSRFYFQEGDRFRMDVPGFSTVVFDPQDNKGIMLVHTLKRAVIIDNANALAGPRNRNNSADLIKTVRALKNLGNKPQSDLGSREFDGKTLRGFVAAQDGLTFTVWADPRTGDPVRIELAPLGDALTDIQLDAAIDPALFKLEIPPAYNRFQVALPNVEGGEASLLTALEGYTRRSGGRFPDRLTDWGDYVRVLRADMIKAAINGSQPQPGALAGPSAEVWEYIANVSAIAPFLASLPKGQYAYLGSGRTKDDSTQMIFWYKPADGPHRAVFSDLTAREIKPEELPRR